ncbi:MAG: lysophospholipid acyltransferase family protein [Bacteroidales bacterium]|nr:lysophospholipid acyltransferase family protein [Bacteroidales bacterium]
MTSYTHTRWQGHTDGTPWMQKALTSLLSFVPLPLAYCLMAPAIPFYMIFGKGYRSSFSFFRDRLGYGPLKSFAHVLGNHYQMGKLVIDRFAAYAGVKFDFEREGDEDFQRLLGREGGFVMLSSHVGNYELAGYSIPTREKCINALVFAGETPEVMAGRQKMFNGTNIRMVPVSEDLTHIFVLNDVLSRGDIASMPADRIFGSKKNIRLPFLGEYARFPKGPFALAMAKEVPMVAVWSMKESTHRYRLIIKALKGDSAEALARSYAGALESVVRRYPDQWFNFYDFWNEA